MTKRDAEHIVMLISCPWCGPRNQIEFTYGGDATLRRPAPDAPDTAWVDYVSFDDRFPPALQLRIVRIGRTEIDLRLYDLNVRAFLAEVDAELAAVTQLVKDDDEDVA